MNTERTTYQSSENRKAQTELQNRYGRIAISAVAAALTCGRGSDNATELRKGAESGSTDSRTSGFKVGTHY